MQYVRQYVQSAELICSSYDGSLPLAAFLKQYFSRYKKFGSRDRKAISHLCYTFYRLGKAAMYLPVEERVKLALFLCEDTSGNWAGLFEEDWLQKWLTDLDDRIQFVKERYTDFQPKDIFQWTGHLSDGIAADEFCISHFRQPGLFLRLRPGHEQQAQRKLDDAGIRFETRSAACLELPNASKVDTVLQLNKEAVVQDMSSQRVADFFPVQEVKTLWDCCAASGGKTILAHDYLEDVQITATDIRPAIIANLKTRLKEAGIGNVIAQVHDVSSSSPWKKNRTFDLVLCDVPCSGSGTWGRTPEQLYYFNETKINEYVALQQRITNTAASAMHSGSRLLYITCSVFREENEQQVERLIRQHGLQLIKCSVIKGYDRRADTMFAALLVKD